jgi:D-serine deaminase-like pyridoxal phosphate-dependent protein
MPPKYHIDDTSDIITPALIVFRELLEDNLDRMIRIAGRPDRLRPHCKTHKIREIAELQLAKGITKHKCATFAEAEMLARAGVRDIFLAYNLVGPNIRRAIAFREQRPDVTLAVTADHREPVAQLGQAASERGIVVDVLLDIDTGMHRTGLEVGPEALRLYKTIAETPGLKPAGLQVYDGHNHQRSFDERKAAVYATWEGVMRFRDELVGAGYPVPKIVVGGTGTFPIFAAMSDATLELSPGTTVFYDVGYSEAFPDLSFNFAAVLLTRVISRPGPQRLTLDVGTKAVASDPPMGKRLTFPDLPDATQVVHNEEHLVLETPHAERFRPGDELLAIPRHICPTTALHKQVYVVAGGRVVDRWEVVARDRWLTI